MKLNEIQDNKGARKNPIRVGRGIGSGKGKTAGRGVKGQTSRSGVAINGFEGGQMPLYRKLPHRGFNNYKFRVEYSGVNVGSLEDLGLEEITRDDLVVAGLVRASDPLVKILGTGELTKKIVVRADKFSETAIKKIEAAGGKAILNADATVSE